MSQKSVWDCRYQLNSWYLGFHFFVLLLAQIRLTPRHHRGYKGSCQLENILLKRGKYFSILNMMLIFDVWWSWQLSNTKALMLPDLTWPDRWQRNIYFPSVAFPGWARERWGRTDGLSATKVATPSPNLAAGEVSSSTLRLNMTWCGLRPLTRCCTDCPPSSLLLHITQYISCRVGWKPEKDSN